MKTFQIQDVNDSDGADVTNVNLGPAFPYGFFICHHDGKPCQLVITAFEDLGLEIDTSYDPRTGTYATED